MPYQTRHLVALAEFRHDGQDRVPGRLFEATEADAGYLERTGHARKPTAEEMGNQPAAPPAAETPARRPVGRPRKEPAAPAAAPVSGGSALMTSADPNTPPASEGLDD